MAYISSNPRTKKALKESLENHEHITVFQPGGLFPLTPDFVKDGKAYVGVEGPHYPKPHSWYGCVEYDPVTKVVTRVVEIREATKLRRG